MVRIVWLVSQILAILLLTRSSSSSVAEEVPSFAMPNCTDRCGDVVIPYPFGIGANCFHDSSFEILCNMSFHPPKPYLRQYDLEVMDISLPPLQQYFGTADQVIVVGISPRNICEMASVDVPATTSSKFSSVDFTGSPYRFSTGLNVFRAETCGSNLVLKNRIGKTLTQCASMCVEGDVKVRTTDCFGIGCCQASLLPSQIVENDGLDQGLDFYQISLDHTALARSNNCMLAAGLIDSQAVPKLTGGLSQLSKFPTVLAWSAAKVLGTQKHLKCTEDKCGCAYPYVGNPYLPNGCQVIKECQKCRHHCYVHDLKDTESTSHHYYCKKRHLLKRASVFGFSIGMGVVLLCLGCYWLHIVVRKRKETQDKANYFKNNGGLILQQQLSSSDGGEVQKSKIFTANELEQATENYCENRILGQGGQGTVYKGMLMDGMIVAVKKAKKIDESQLEHFINEVVILSQINHRNVVKLLGCCLETKVPLLVYEFIPNGTLYQLIHDPSEEFHLTWKMRLQIAAESAGALAYLHSSSSSPIYHRDIKSSNMLLDDKYRAKISDFGTSRAITIEQTHLTTCVQGTFGYLDPEYFRSNQFTEKSDVYSFGVVLVELLTGRKPIYATTSGGWISLANQFLSEMEYSPIFDLLDSRVVEAGKEEEFTTVAELARRCLNMNGKLRPTMREVSMILNEMR